jgi:PST family polysaccharide transporter
MTNEHTRADIRRRSGRAIAALTGRGFVLNVIAFLASIALSRLLTPREFGFAAVGMAISGFAAIIGDGGLAAGLIRARIPPDRTLLGSVLGLQLLVMGAFAASLGLVATIVNIQLLSIAAIVGLSLPLSALKLPAIVCLERELNYGPIAKIDLGSALIYYIVAISLAVHGAGAWSLALAPIGRETFAAITFFLLVPAGRVRPRLEFANIRPLLQFGVQFQAVGVVHTLRDQGIASLSGALGGLSTAGYSSLVFRLLQLPLIILNPLWRVSYSAYSRLVADGGDHAILLERGMAIVIWPLGLCCTVLAAGAGPMINILFGPEWSPTAAALPWAAVGMFIGGAASVTCAGYLYAVGAVRMVLVSGVAHTFATLLIIGILTPSLGVTAVGLGWLANGLVEAALLIRAARLHSAARITQPLVVATLVMLAATICGQRAGELASNQGLQWVVAATVGAILFLAGATVLLGRERTMVIAQISAFRRDHSTSDVGQTEGGVER